MEEQRMDVKMLYALAQVQLGGYVPEGILDETYTNSRFEISNLGHYADGTQIAPWSVPFAREFARVDDKWQRVK